MEPGPGRGPGAGDRGPEAVDRGLRPGGRWPKAQSRGSDRCGDRMRGRNGLVGRAVGGQGERDAQPVRVVEAGLRRAVVGGGDGVDDGEAEAGSGRAAPARPAAVEAVEDAGELSRGHTGAVVADLDDDAAVAPGGGEG